MICTCMSTSCDLNVKLASTFHSCLIQIFESQNKSWPYQHVTQVVWAGAEAAGLRVFRTAGARVQKGARVQTVRHASHAGKLLQEVSGHAHGLRGQIAWRLPKDATEGTVQNTEHWRKRRNAPIQGLLRGHAISESSAQEATAICLLRLFFYRISKLQKMDFVLNLQIDPSGDTLNCFLKFVSSLQLDEQSKENWVLCWICRL